MRQRTTRCSVASAPGKVILFGEHFVMYGCGCLLAAIPNRTTVTSGMTDDGTISIMSDVGNVTTDADGPVDADDPLGPVTFIAKRFLRKNEGMRISISSSIPVGRGLGSSSAACVAAAGSISNLFGKQSLDGVYGLALEAERAAFPEASGADTAVCTYGGILEWNSGKRETVGRAASTPPLRISITDSMERRSTSGMVAAVSAFRKSNGSRFARLVEMEKLIIRRARDAIVRGDVKMLGMLMRENQTYLDEIGVSTDRLNHMILEKNSTAYGSKITGAGGGGCIISIGGSYNTMLGGPGISFNQGEAAQT